MPAEENDERLLKLNLDSAAHFVDYELSDKRQLQLYNGSNKSNIRVT